MADNDSDEARALGPLQAATCACGIAFGLRAGQKVLTGPGTMPREKGVNPARRADKLGFSLHAAVRCAADDDQAQQQPGRCVTRNAQD